MVEEIMFSGTHAHGVELVAKTKRNLSAHLRAVWFRKITASQKQVITFTISSVRNSPSL